MYAKIFLYYLGQYQKRTFSSIKDPKTQILQLFKLIGIFILKLDHMHDSRFDLWTYFTQSNCNIYLVWDPTVAKKRQNYDHTLHSEAQLYQAQKPDTSCNWREKVVCKIFSGKAGIVRSEKSIVTRFFFGGWEFSSSSPFGCKAWAECLLRSFSLCHTKACQSQGEKVNMLWLAQPELRKWKVISIDINSRKTGLNTSIATAARAPKL